MPAKVVAQNVTTRKSRKIAAVLKKPPTRANKNKLSELGYIPIDSQQHTKKRTKARHVEAKPLPADIITKDFSVRNYPEIIKLAKKGNYFQVRFPLPAIRGEAADHSSIASLYEVYKGTGPFATTRAENYGAAQGKKKHKYTDLIAAVRNIPGIINCLHSITYKLIRNIDEKFELPIPANDTQRRDIITLLAVLFIADPVRHPNPELVLRHQLSFYKKVMAGQASFTAQEFEKEFQYAATAEQGRAGTTEKIMERPEELLFNLLESDTPIKKRTQLREQILHHVPVSQRYGWKEKHAASPLQSPPPVGTKLFRLRSYPKPQAILFSATGRVKFRGNSTHDRKSSKENRNPQGSIFERPTKDITVANKQLVDISQSSSPALFSSETFKSPMTPISTAKAR